MKLEHAPVPALRPSEYTAALIQVLQSHANRIKDSSVLEIGPGSGVVLAALGAMGARTLCGVDIEKTAVDITARLLADMGFGDRAELFHGDLWQPLSGRRFDLIAANLPHFPMEPVEVAGRLPTWSGGGADGRRLLDLFLADLPHHLTGRGMAVITHNGFVDLDKTRALVKQSGLEMRVASTTLIYIVDAKLDLMTDSVLCAEDGRSIHRYGPYTLADMHIVEIAAAGVLA